jgi:solute carrier family 12 (sodium/potassium/chloride transporter), member 2
MQHLTKKNLGFGTVPVFLTTLSTILGAILFLRFGYAAGHVGFWGLIGIVLLGHLVTIPTAMAIAEIATNQKVLGGGAYYMISRSFGLNIGSAVGICLYIAQAISVSFYVIAFSEAFTPVFDWLRSEYGFYVNDTRWVSIPAILIINFLIFYKGANIGMKALYLVVGILLVSLVSFFLGSPIDANHVPDLSNHIHNPDSFFYVFTIVFPAFTGIIAGLGLSGDLKDPKKSIPLGTIAAVMTGFVIYIFAAIKLVYCAGPEQLAEDQLIMSRIAIWGPIIPIGLGAATISSALGSIMIAPRTLQMLSSDKVFLNRKINSFLSKGKIKDNEPRNAALVTGIIALFFVAIGSVNFIAEIISMFFMVTYGAICLISFLEHFAADPAYRPSFKSRWQFSFIGTILSFWLMFQMNLPYALFALALMVSIYLLVNSYQKNKEGLANIFQGVIFQSSRKMWVFLQKSDRNEELSHWRPSIVCISSNSFKRFDAFELLKWISQKYGFGTYIHLIHGYLSKSTFAEAKMILEKLLNLGSVSKSNVYMDTLISPSYTSAIAQVIQLPSVSGKENNMIFFEFSRKDPDNLDQILDNLQILRAVDFDVCILGTTPRSFGYRKELHIWLSSKDFRNANLMILISYIILGHKDWKKGQIKIFAVFPKDEMEVQRKHLLHSIKTGRLPISSNNINVIAQKENESLPHIISTLSEDADLTLVGFREEQVKKFGKDFFLSYSASGNILFVNTGRERNITLE